MQVHVLMCSEGSYDDYSEWMVKGYPTPERAQAAMEVEQAKDARFNQLRDIFGPLVLDLRKEFPMPMSGAIALPKYPQGIKKKDLPQTYLDAKKAAEEHNQRAHVLHENAIENWNGSVRVGIEAILATLNMTPEERGWFDEDAANIWHMSRRDYSYDVEILEVEE